MFDSSLKVRRGLCRPEICKDFLTCCGSSRKIIRSLKTTISVLCTRGKIRQEVTAPHYCRPASAVVMKVKFKGAIACNRQRRITSTPSRDVPIFLVWPQRTDCSQHSWQNPQYQNQRCGKRKITRNKRISYISLHEFGNKVCRTNKSRKMFDKWEEHAGEECDNRCQVYGDFVIAMTSVYIQEILQSIFKLPAAHIIDFIFTSLQLSAKIKYLK